MEKLFVNVAHTESCGLWIPGTHEEEIDLHIHWSNEMLGTRKLEEMLRNTGGAEGRGWSGEQWE